MSHLVLASDGSANNVSSKQAQAALLAALQTHGPAPGSRELLELEKASAEFALATGIYVVWRSSTGNDCTRIGPHSMCFCGHLYSLHNIDIFANRHPCRECACKRFDFVPVRPEEAGEWWLVRRPGFRIQEWKATCKCKHTHLEHACDYHRKCKKCGCYKFRSSFQCVACDKPSQDHETVWETADERKAANRAINNDFMPLSESPQLAALVFKPRTRKYDTQVAPMQPAKALQARLKQADDIMHRDHSKNLPLQRMQKHDMSDHTVGDRMTVAVATSAVNRVGAPMQMHGRGIGPHLNITDASPDESIGALLSMEAAAIGSCRLNHPAADSSHLAIRSNSQSQPTTVPTTTISTTVTTTSSSSLDRSSSLATRGGRPGRGRGRERERGRALSSSSSSSLATSSPSSEQASSSFFIREDHQLLSPQPTSTCNSNQSSTSTSSSSFAANRVSLSSHYPQVEDVEVIESALPKHELDRYLNPTQTHGFAAVKPSPILRTNRSQLRFSNIKSSRAVERGTRRRSTENTHNGPRTSDTVSQDKRASCEKDGFIHSLAGLEIVGKDTRSQAAWGPSQARS